MLHESRSREAELADSTQIRFSRRASEQAYLTTAERHALLVVAAEGLAVDEGERGDDEDDAGRCRSDARARPSTAFVAAERVGGAVARAGVDITREREKSFSGMSAFVPTRNGRSLPDTSIDADYG